MVSTVFQDKYHRGHLILRIEAVASCCPAEVVVGSELDWPIMMVEGPLKGGQGCVPPDHCGGNVTDVPQSFSSVSEAAQHISGR